jgi:hypothetical protein
LLKCQQTGHITSVEVGEGGKVTIYLKLDQNFRKIKSLIHEGMTAIPWIKNLEVKMAGKVKSFLQPGTF